MWVFDRQGASREILILACALDFFILTIATLLCAHEQQIEYAGKH